MEISYFGHSCFRIKTKTGVVLLDPYNAQVGFKIPSVSADIVTVSHTGHGDHDNIKAVSGTTRRQEPFVITEPGEYEVEGISIFGYQTWHDGSEGKERGPNTIFIIQAEDLRVLHLGDLGHPLSDKLITDLDGIDVMMIPVGGVYTITPDQAVKVAESIDPYYVLPMHYKTDKHDAKMFGTMSPVDKFVSSAGHTTRTVKSLSLSKLALPADSTEVILFD